jgi:dTMP kinase
MKNYSHKGLFIAFEGLDGSGSSTQANLLVNNLRNKKYKAFLTKEPTNNIIGGLIRGQLAGDWSASMECLQLLFAADRAHHLDKDILLVLKKGKIMISDRYLFSSIAYGSLKVDREWLLKLNERFLLPDLTFLLQVPPKICLKRMKANRFTLELFEQEQKLNQVWQTYLWLAKKFKNIILIDGTQTKEKIAEKILTIVRKKLDRLIHRSSGT